MPTKPLSAPLQAVLAQVSLKVREIMQSRFLRPEDVAAERAGLFRCIRATHNMHLSTIVAIADALDHDVVIHFRARPKPSREVPPYVVH